MNLLELNFFWCRCKPGSSHLANLSYKNYQRNSFIHYLYVSCLFRNIESSLMVGGSWVTNSVGQKRWSFNILKMSSTSLSCFLGIRLEMHLEILYNFYIITARNKRNRVRSSQFSASVKPWHGFVWWKISKPAKKESRGCKLFL